MKKKWAIGIIAYVALVALCVIVVYVIPTVRGALVRTYYTEQGEINLTNEVEAYVIRDEFVYTSEAATSVKRQAKEGHLVRGGTKVVELSGEGSTNEASVFAGMLESIGERLRPTETGKTKTAGYIAYSVDGAEGKLTADVAGSIRRADLEDATKAGSRSTVKGACTAGDPIFKVVRNRKYYMVFYLNKDDARDYYEGDNVTVDINGEQISAEVASIKEGKTEKRITLECGMFYSTALTDRKISIVVTTSSAKGLLLQDKSIVEKDGTRGVLVKNKLGDYIFKPVCVKADDGENCVAYQDLYMDEGGNFVETISIYDEIVTSPGEKDIKEAETL